MVKFVRLKVSKIKYTGDSIGDDIRIGIQCLDKFFSLDKRIKKNKVLSFGGNTYSATDSPDAQWKKGKYDIEIPDYPHKGGLNYKSDSKYATIWFRVGHSGDRYIHTGQHSLGCITLIEQDRWNGLCEALLKARKGDDVSVGILTVTD